MSVPTNWWADVTTTSSKIILANSYDRNLMLCASPNNTANIWISFGGPQAKDADYVAVSWSWVALAPWGSINLSDEFGLIGCQVAAIAESGTQRVGFVLN